mmetsp:Transcript_25458/g.76453  ORF Transcript_25458/g.76453 Transcript_25458/m.76453 type:complete len:122 (+) Transcript_25458:236-601(+)
MAEAALADALLASAGVGAADPEVSGAVLETLHRSVQSTLRDARDLCLHRGSTTLAKSDVLAAEDGAFDAPPPRDALLARAAEVNELPIEIPDGHGVRLPPGGAGSLAQRGYAFEVNERPPK